MYISVSAPGFCSYSPLWFLIRSDFTPPVPLFAELEWDPEMQKLGYFSATPDKGNVAPGNSVEVTFSFSPPVIEETYGLDVGQWSRTVVKCNLKGGYAPEGSPEAAVRILLEGYIPV